MKTRAIHWRWRDQVTSLGVDEAGEGETLLLLPALSSVSTRQEMEPLLHALSSQFRVVTADWPGFGDRPRPKIDWTPDILSHYLAWLLEEVVPKPLAIVAAGHAAAYALHHLARHRDAAGRLVLIAPTWRGPFPP